MKSQVSYVLGNPSSEKGGSSKDFNQKSDEMQRKIEDTEKLLVFILQNSFYKGFLKAKASEEKNRYKQEISQIKTYGPQGHETEKGIYKCF